MHELIVAAGGWFSPEAYLVTTRIQCLLWTGADVVIVYSLLRIANLARAMTGGRPHRFSFAVLALTLLPVPGVAFAQTGMAIFALELIITVPHFLMILYVIGANYRGFALALSALLQAGPEPIDCRTQNSSPGAR